MVAHDNQDSRMEKWIRQYVKAWISSDAADIRALFADDADYYREPFAEPWSGLGEIIYEWQRIGDSGLEWSLEHAVVTDCDDLGVVRVVTRYLANDFEPGREYHSVWLVRFDGDGRAREFTEWRVEMQATPSLTAYMV